MSLKQPITLTFYYRVALLTLYFVRQQQHCVHFELSESVTALFLDTSGGRQVATESLERAAG